MSSTANSKTLFANSYADFCSCLEPRGSNSYCGDWSANFTSRSNLRILFSGLGCAGLTSEIRKVPLRGATVLLLGFAAAVRETFGGLLSLLRSWFAL